MGYCARHSFSVVSTNWILRELVYIVGDIVLIMFLSTYLPEAGARATVVSSYGDSALGHGVQHAKLKVPPVERMEYLEKPLEDSTAKQAHLAQQISAQGGHLAALQAYVHLWRVSRQARSLQKKKV